MLLFRQGQVMKSYRISLGRNGEKGRKQREGDQRTPEGNYIIDWRNPGSKYYLSLHISYPNADDLRRARAAGYSAGGNIMIHGLPNGWGWLAPVLQLWDWTDGCITVTNSEIREIRAKVSDRTPVQILP